MKGEKALSSERMVATGRGHKKSDCELTVLHIDPARVEFRISISSC